MNDSSTTSCCEPARTPAAPDDAAIGRTQKLVAAGGILGAIAASGAPEVDQATIDLEIDLIEMPGSVGL